jgi:hypothetical protein
MHVSNMSKRHAETTSHAASLFRFPYAHPRPSTNESGAGTQAGANQSWQGSNPQPLSAWHPANPTHRGNPAPVPHQPHPSSMSDAQRLGVMIQNAAEAAGRGGLYPQGGAQQGGIAPGLGVSNVAQLLQSGRLSAEQAAQLRTLLAYQGGHPGGSGGQMSGSGGQMSRPGHSQVRKSYQIKNLAYVLRWTRVLIYSRIPLSGILSGIFLSGILVQVGYFCLVLLTLSSYK